MNGGVHMAIRNSIIGLVLIGLIMCCHRPVSIDDEKAAIKNVILLQNKAANEKSISGEAAVWAHEPYIYRRTGSGSYKTGWDSISAWYQKSFSVPDLNPDTYSETWQNWDIHLFRDMAWAAYDHLVIFGRDTVRLNEFRFLEKQKQGWKLIMQQTDWLSLSRTSKWPYLESDLNGIGYALLKLHRITEAIKVLQLNTEFFPESANAYDSLGDAYLAGEDKAHAKACYEKAVAIDPGNKVSAEKLKKL
jgi:tetratricopeptide (TPR) repeat protein